MYPHWLLHTSVPLLPQLCSHCCRSNGRASVSQKSAWRHLSLQCSLPLSSLLSSTLSAWWISQAPKAGICFKAESVPCPPCELTTFLALGFVESQIAVRLPVSGLTLWFPSVPLFFIHYKRINVFFAFGDVSFLLCFRGCLGVELCVRHLMLKHTSTHTWFWSSINIICVVEYLLTLCDRVNPVIMWLMLYVFVYFCFISIFIPWK